MATPDTALGIVDRPHLPLPGSPGREIFKEWYHFNLLVPEQGLDVIANVSLAGDVTRAGSARADVIALCHVAGEGWSGTIDSYEAAAATIDNTTLDLTLGPNRIAYRDGAYRLSIRLRDEPFLLEAQLVPRSEPMLIWNDTPVGAGRLNWLIVPALDASGRLTAAGTTRIFERAAAYHDHNWGHWKWGDDFSWEWGFTGHSPTADGKAITLVFDRTANRLGDTILEQTLAVWIEGDLGKIFTREMLKARRYGFFDGSVPRIPGPSSLIDQGEVLNVPAEYRVSARDNADWLDLAYTVEACLQVAVPTDFGFGLIGLNETFGNCAIRGEVGGMPFEFTARSCFEFMS